MPKKPRIGDIVLVGYQNADYTPTVEPLPAIVVKVHQPDNPESDLDLVIFNGIAISPAAATRRSVPYSSTPAVDMWSWRPDDA